MDLFQRLQEKAKSNPKKVVFPEATDAKILQAARQVKDLGLGFPSLVGETRLFKKRQPPPASRWTVFLLPTTPMRLGSNRSLPLMRR
jgi:hypothetical protein